MPSEIPSTPKSYASSPIDPAKGSDRLDPVQFIPSTLSSPITLEELQRGAECVRHHYPVHSTTEAVSRGLDQGLELEPQKGLPLSKVSRALAAALAQALGEKKG